MLADRIVIMGVSGCGKSTVGAALAERLGGRFLDGDDFHPQANILKMSAGEPLVDADRLPWLDRIGARLAAPESGPLVMACSALRQCYRDRLRQRAGQDVVFVLLQGTRGLIEQRLQQRSGHFMPPALLDSQFATLEPFGSGELAITVDISGSVEAIVDRVCLALARA